MFFAIGYRDYMILHNYSFVNPFLKTFYFSEFLCIMVLGFTQKLCKITIK